MANKKISQLEKRSLAQMRVAGAFLAMAVSGEGTFKVPATDVGSGGEIVHDSTLTGNGTTEAPLSIDRDTLDEIVTEDVGQALETLRSKLIYTLDLGAVQAGISMHGNGSIFAKATLFNPNMNQEIVAGTTKVIFATNQGGSCQKLFFSLYRYDVSDNTIHWIANTGNVAQSVSQNGVHAVPVTQCAVPNDGKPLQLLSSKLYYLVIFTDANGVKFIGNTYSENFNTVPLLGWYADNLSTVTEDTLQTVYPTISPNGENRSRFFAAISNIDVSTQDQQ